MNVIETIKNTKPKQVLKIGGLIIVAIVILAFVINLLGASFGSLSIGKGGVSLPSADFGYGIASREAGFDESVATQGVSGGIIRPPIPSPGTVGSDAEEFEVTEYHSSIETRNLTEVCDAITDLKALPYVIFESADENDKNCDYTFKVEIASAPEILAVIENLDPKELTERIYTIKRTLEDIESEEDVLLRKKVSIEETLRASIRAYDDITALATRTENAEALASIIESRVKMIERLTQEIIAINERLDRLARAKEEQMDRLQYTYFYVSVFESKFVDFEALGDSWKAAIQDFVRDVNKTVQDVTVGLAALLIGLAKYALYLLILLFAVKYGWRIGVAIWRK